jgi:hypothetical protein
MKKPSSRWGGTQQKPADYCLRYSTLGKRLHPAKLASTLQGKSPGPCETEQLEDHIRATATLICPEDSACDPTTVLLPSSLVSTIIEDKAMHNTMLCKAVVWAGLKPIKCLTSAVLLFNSTELSIAGVYCKTLCITDATKETRLQTVTLQCIDLHEFNIVLGMPRTTRARPVFHWSE